MSRLKKQLIDNAIKQYNRIFPCAPYKEFDECFTEEKNRIIFWFNTEDNSTHAICLELIS